MMDQHSKYPVSGKSNSFIDSLMLLLVGFVFLFSSACTHDPVVGPIDPGPDPDPIDTTENPIDTSDTGVPCDPAIIYFDMDILPILHSNCAKSGCHDAITHQEGIILDSYENVMNSDVIKPFDL